MQVTKCSAYVLCLAAVLVTLAPAQTANPSQPTRPRRVELQRALASFASWTKRYSGKSGAIAGPKALEEGVALAKQRRSAIRQLIQSDPALALAAVLPGEVRRALPREVADELESEVAGTGDFIVACAMPAQGSTQMGMIQRTVRLDGRTYRAYVYGRRLGETTRFKIALHGIALDDVMALDESVLTQLDPTQPVDAAEPVVDLSGSAGRFAGVGPARLARLGQTVYRFASPEHLQHCEALLEEAESNSTPVASRPASVLLESGFAPRPDLEKTNRPLAVPAPVRKVLVVRTDFSDLPGDPRWPRSGPLTADVVQDIANNQIAAYFQNCSYGKASLAFTVSPQLYRLPQTAMAYARQYGYEMLHNDALAAAQSDYYLDDYSVVIVLFTWLVDLPGSQIQFGGISILDTSYMCVNGEFDFRVVAHELGHTYGLYHANVWKSNDGNPLSDFGWSEEYGDLFDTMGANMGGDHRTDFNPWFKSMLNWISAEQVLTVTSNGLYRVNRFDDPAATGTLALRIVKDWNRNYWIGCRRSFTENQTMEQGAYVVWGYNYNRQSDLLCLGQTPNNARDAALRLGGVLADPEANLIVNVVGQGGTAPNQYIDVQVTFAHPPMFASQPQTQQVLEEQGAAFAVASADYPAPAFSWQHQAAGSANWVTLSDGADFSGTGSPILLVNSTTLAMNGDLFRCLLTNSSGGYNISWTAALAVDRSGQSTLAGQPGVAGYADGLGRFAQFDAPTGIGFDLAGNAYVADSGNLVIRKITQAGVVTTLAGTVESPGSDDGVGADARFDFPSGIAVDPEGNVYVTDQVNSTIRKIDPRGVVATLAGAAGHLGSEDGLGSAARFSLPGGIAADCFGNLFVADTGNNTVRKITPNGLVSTIAGVAGQPGFADGLGLNSRLNHPTGIAVDLWGNLYIADQQNAVVRKIDTQGEVSTLAGSPGLFGNADGLRADARFSSPSAVAVAANGMVYVADGTNSIRTISPDGLVSTLTSAVANPPLLATTVGSVPPNYPQAVAVGSHGTLYFTDNATVQMVRSSAAEAPLLRISLAAGQLVLSWPASAGNYTLETRNSLSAQSAWTPVASQPAVVGCNLVLTNDIQTPAAFFRLHAH